MLNELTPLASEEFCKNVLKVRLFPAPLIGFSYSNNEAFGNSTIGESVLLKIVLFGCIFLGIEIETKNNNVISIVKLVFFNVFQ